MFDKTEDHNKLLKYTSYSSLLSTISNTNINGNYGEVITEFYVFCYQNVNVGLHVLFRAKFKVW